MDQLERWQVAGNASEIYEQDLVPAIFGPWAESVVDLTSPRPGDRILDVACGTGIVARAAAVRVGSDGAVIGVDLNAGMLAIARSITPEITWREASADSLPFKNGSLDIAYCQLGLQYFPDRPAALREMHRVLRPTGRLGLMVWRGIDESPGFAALANALERHINSDAAAIMRAPFCLSDTDALAKPVRDAGFQDVAIIAQVGAVRFASAESLVRAALSRAHRLLHMYRRQHWLA